MASGNEGIGGDLRPGGVFDDDGGHVGTGQVFVDQDNLAWVAADSGLEGVVGPTDGQKDSFDRVGVESA